jgi:hypothetical protein
LRRSDIIFIVIIATLLWLILHYRAQPAQAQAMFYSATIGDGNIEPPPYLGPPLPLEAAIPRLPPLPPPLQSYYIAPPPYIDLDAPAPLDLPPPPTVVIQQLPPIIMTRTCSTNYYYKGGKRYYHTKPHCTEPDPLPQELIQ